MSSTREAELEAEVERLREEKDAAYEYAKEGWSWLDIALDAGGWPTVFDIPDWKERSRRLNHKPDAPEGGTDG